MRLLAHNINIYIYINHKQGMTAQHRSVISTAMETEPRNPEIKVSLGN